MGTRSQHRSHLRVPLWTLQLVGMVASAAIVVTLGWFLLQAFLGMGSYIETVVP